MPADTKTLIEKIEALPAERIAEIEDFVDFIGLREQERSLSRRDRNGSHQPASAESPVGRDMGQPLASGRVAQALRGQTGAQP